MVRLSIPRNDPQQTGCIEQVSRQSLGAGAEVQCRQMEAGTEEVQTDYRAKQKAVLEDRQLGKCSAQKQ
jgi:hypothetical protein